MKSKINVLIAIYEMIGGIVGVCITIYTLFSMFESKYIEILGLLLDPVMLILYVLSIRGGFLLWKGKEKGIGISVIVQIFQIPYIITSSLVYYFVSGLQIVVGTIISSNMIKIMATFQLGSLFAVYFENTVKSIELGINIIPIVVILYLRRIKKIAKSNQLEDKNEVANVADEI